MEYIAKLVVAWLYSDNLHVDKYIQCQNIQDLTVSFKLICKQFPEPVEVWVLLIMNPILGVDLNKPYSLMLGLTFTMYLYILYIM